MSKIIVETVKGQKAGMAFMMTEDTHPILVQFNDANKFMKKLNENKFVHEDKIAFVEEWDMDEGRYVTDKCGWIINTVFDTSRIKWVKFI